MSKRSLDNLLVKNNIIETTQLEIFNYGLTVAVLLMANLIAAIITSLFLGTVFYCIMFIILFVPIRRYSGGFHAGSSLVCFLESQILILTAQLLATKLPRIGYLYEILLLISLVCAVIIFLKSPIYSRYKPLNSIEVKIYGCRAKCLSVIYFLLEFIFYAFGYYKLFILFFTTFFFQGILLFIPERAHKKSPDGLK